MHQQSVVSPRILGVALLGELRNYPEKQLGNRQKHSSGEGKVEAGPQAALFFIRTLNSCSDKRAQPRGKSPSISWTDIRELRKEPGCAHT